MEGSTSREATGPSCKAGMALSGKMSNIAAVSKIRWQISHHPNSQHNYVRIYFLRGTMLREQFQMACQNDSEGYVVEAQRHSNLFIVRGYLPSTLP